MVHMLSTAACTETATSIAELLANPECQDVLPSSESLEKARAELPTTLPKEGWGLERVAQHLTKCIVPALNANSQSPNYYGFVTGGVTPAAAIADNIVTAYDQNVQVHLPNETIATEVEDRASAMLCELLDFDPSRWPHRTFTTGATASNVVGLACGREFVIENYAISRGEEISVSELGGFKAMRCLGLEDIQILTTVPHSSLSKAASLIGLGRSSVKDISVDGQSSKIDIGKLRAGLELPNVVTIVALSCSEVNTGHFATENLQHMLEIRALCDLHGAWIHVDGAFGIFGRVLDAATYPTIVNSCAGLELADSVTGDGHKLLNVPYDCGFLFSRSVELATRTFQNPNAAYLASGAQSTIPSPLNVGIENSRRFRALPVYANLTTYGKTGYKDMLERQIALSRTIAKYIHDSDAYDLLPRSDEPIEKILEGIFIIVILRAKDEKLNKNLVNLIKQTSKIYVSGTTLDGSPACRFAVSNWQVDVERDMKLIREVLDNIAAQSTGHNGIGVAMGE